MEEEPSSPLESHQPGEDREASLPPIPAVSWDAQTQSFAKRKRSTASQIFSDSSDPAIFSSDDDPALDNYVEGRHKKKRYVGSWFQQRPASRSSDSGIMADRRPTYRGKRAFVPVDSGVFMGSDGSIDDILDELSPPQTNTAVFPPAVVARPSPRPVPAQLSQVPRGSQTSQLPEAEANAQAVIRRCIEDGDENVDLADLGLKHVSNATISLISEIDRIPNVGKGVPFEHQDPELKLFLWNNQLTQVPRALFNLDNLTLLSLRGNSLTELPPAISQLKNLQTLNVSQNRLKYLPVELLELIHDPECSLERLVLHPNPWHQPEVEDSRHNVPWTSENVDRPQPGPGPQERGRRTWLSDIPPETRTTSNFDAKRWARTPVQFSDTKGTLYSTFRIRPDTTQLPTEDLDFQPAIPLQNPAQERVFHTGGAKTTKVPSLLELALQACSRNPYLAELPGMLTGTTVPARNLLADAQAHSYTGGVACTVCRRPVVRPTAEWVEWWKLFVRCKDTGPRGEEELEVAVEGLAPRMRYLAQIPEERLVPFVRRACSWVCVMDTVRGLGV